ncbi:DNA-binding HxlR family transcriptional regulator [Paraburkholderia youngii]|uniref:winged helix-turn-helix transcriptional regulator n=1 Tax=Paraburkholderia youngii TaxID=2782701 RepID=UPI003D201106
MLIYTFFPMETNDFDGSVAHQSAQTNTDELARNIIEQIADKWTILVIDALGTHGVMRFSRLREHIGNVSQKMLTKTLRQLERDGLVSRHVHPVIPPRVDYHLTQLGRSLLDKVCGIWDWVEAHAAELDAARQQFDRREKRSNIAEPLVCVIND